MSVATSQSTARAHTRSASSLRLALRDIKIAHSVFALPFAVLAVFLAANLNQPRRIAGQLGLVVVCMVLARTWAMLFNRIADRRLDIHNPRTSGRAVASGALPLRTANLYALASALAFILCCGLFWVFFDNAWPLMLCVPTLGWIAFYSVTKRFTILCHLFLGGALAFSPIAAAIAVNPDALRTTPALWWISGMVLVWVAGFDILYALQDLEFDRETGLNSIPARLGPSRSAWISRALHAGALACLIGAALSEPRFGALFWLAVALVGALLVIEHVILVRRGLDGLPMAFFTVNGVVSCGLSALAIADIVASHAR
jgi:4-hydroxybenzoate polyprenyltransferase